MSRFTGLGNAEPGLGSGCFKPEPWVLSMLLLDFYVFKYSFFQTLSSYFISYADYKCVNQGKLNLLYWERFEELGL